MKSNLTACPLDCYDACSVVWEDGKLKGDPNHKITRGHLCPNLNAFLKTPRIEEAKLHGEKIPMDRALEILVQKLQEVDPAKALYFKGHGNFGVMGEIVGDFFARYGAMATSGSLCDSAGEYGIVCGRGRSRIMTPQEIAKCDTVVVWGRNIDTTNSHLMPFIEGKDLIVIDPIQTVTAKHADLHLQIKPKDDMKLAILLARFIVMQEMVDEAFIEDRTDNFDYFIDFINSYRVKYLMRDLGISATEINRFLDLVADRKVAFLVGVGVQKYRHGHSVLHMIDSLSAMLGNFGKEGCGVSYLGESRLDFSLPFQKSKSTVPIVNADFSRFDLSFIQGANPAQSMPHSSSVREHLKACGFVVYFGLYENETSELADLIIPAKRFLAKSDLRFSYGHDYLLKMPRLIAEDIGISEYELASLLFDRFGMPALQSEAEILDAIVASNSYAEGDYLRSRSYQEESYKERFDTDDETFYFIDEMEEESLGDEEEADDRFYLITAKAKHSLNSQFKRSRYLYLPRSAGFNDGDWVVARSDFGAYRFQVKNDYRLREDCLLIYSGTPGVNFLTPPFLSQEGEGACYQEVRVALERVDS